MNKITDSDIARIAKNIDVEPAALKAVDVVESAGAGFLPSGKCKILFEGHIFWRQLVNAGINPKLYASKHPNILFENWDKSKYLGGEAEHSRLDEAATICRYAALKSASWGRFQLMGFNYKLCGFVDVVEFTMSMAQSEINQLRAAAEFITSNKTMFLALKNKDWATFAKLYNGPRYFENKYDIKLRGAYAENLKLNAL